MNLPAKACPVHDHVELRQLWVLYVVAVIHYCLYSSRPSSGRTRLLQVEAPDGVYSLLPAFNDFFRTLIRLQPLANGAVAELRHEFYRRVERARKEHVSVVAGGRRDYEGTIPRRVALTELSRWLLVRLGRRDTLPLSRTIKRAIAAVAGNNDHHRGTISLVLYLQPDPISEDLGADRRELVIVELPGWMVR